MNIQLISIGNSKGIRIPKAVLEQCGVEEEFVMEIVDENIMLKPVRNHKNLSFEDIKSMTDKEIQRLLKRIDATTLSISLIGCDKETKSRIFTNLSKKAYEVINDEIARLENLDAKSLIVEMQRGKINNALGNFL